MRDFVRLIGRLWPYAGRVAASFACTLVGAALSVLLVSLTVSLMAALQSGGGGERAARPREAPQAAAGAEAAPGSAPESLPLPVARLRGDLLAKAREWAPELPPLRSGGAAFVSVGMWVLGLVLARGVFEFLSDYNLKLVGLWVTRDLRGELYERLLRQPLAFFWQHPTGALMSRVTGDVGRLQRIVSGELAEILRLAPILVGQVAYVFYLYPDLSLLLAVALPLISWPILRIGRKLKRASRKSQERMADLSSVLQETIAGVRVVKAFGAERFEGARFRQRLERMLRPDRRALRFGALTTPVIDLAGALALAFFLVAVGWRLGAGGADLSTLPAFLAGLTYVFLSAKSLARLNNSVQQGMAAARRVFQILDLPAEPIDDPASPALPPFRDRIEFEGVHFSYGRREALRGVDLTVRAGEIVALVGQSGAGKSTLVSLLPRFFDPTAGVVRFDGRDIRSARLSSLRAQIGLVSQDIVLFDDTVRRNIAYASAQATQEAVERAARAACAHDFIRALPEGYETRLGEGGQSLSAGQRQRLAIARALLKDPPILILDEATSALDAESEALLQAALDNLMRGRTVFVIAHRLSTVRRADRILVLEAGRVAEAGTHAELMAHGRLYRRLHDLQFRDEAAPARQAGPSSLPRARPAL
jgi:subfamily B ATP-binding cassette protein MsbA